MKFNFIRQHQNEFSISLMCKLLKVARSSYYAYSKRSNEPSKQAKANELLLEKIKVLFAKHKQRYGSPRIHASLKQQGESCSLGRVKRLMRKAGLYALNPKQYKPKQEKSDITETKNLLLDQTIKATSINQIWHSDITYISTDEGWLYLAGTMDGFSKRLVGYAMNDNMKTDLVIQALRSAVARRKPAKGLIHHSDKGGQYTSYAFERELKNQDMRASFTGTGACLDNAIIESFWATLKKELVYQNHFKTRDEARLAIFEYIEVYYNRERLHSSLLYQTPEGFEMAQQIKEPQTLMQKAA